MYEESVCVRKDNIVLNIEVHLFFTRYVRLQVAGCSRPRQPPPMFLHLSTNKFLIHGHQRMFFWRERGNFFYRERK